MNQVRRARQLFYQRCTRKNYSSGTNHFGLVGMKQRAEFINAKLEITSEFGEGSQIKLVKYRQSPDIKEGVINF